MRIRTRLELLFGLIGATLVVIGVLVTAQGVGVLGGAVLGVGLGLLITLVLSLAARPSIRVEVAKDEYNPDAKVKWVHLAVSNTSSGFLGNGEISDCRATLIFREGKGPFHPKWASRPNPHRLQAVSATEAPGGAQFILVADEHLYDQAKTESLPVSEPIDSPVLLDVAYKYLGSKDCYISEPEHFRGAGPSVIIEQVPRRAIGEGRHRFTVELRERGLLVLSKDFTLVNLEGSGPEGLLIEAA